MRAMDIFTAIKSGSFNVRPCGCGKQAGCEHVDLVAKSAVLMDVRDQEVRSFFSMTASYVKVIVTYHGSLRSRAVSASWEVRNPAGDLVLRSDAKPVPHVLVPTSEAGEEKLFALLRIRSALFEAATRKRAA